MAVIGETEPLLGVKPREDVATTRFPVGLIYFCVFLVSLSVTFTWVPVVYVLRVMTCDEYYKQHAPFGGSGDRCGLSVIEASSARAVSLMGMTSTCCGVINLLVTNYQIKTYGVKKALIMQTFWPAIRLCFQIFGVTIGGSAGIAVIQITQFICVLGGPAGYLLVTNTYASELVRPHERTSALGVLQGCVMFGTAIGFLLGGLTGDIFGIRSPFQIAFALMSLSSIYVLIFLPYIAPPPAIAASKSIQSQGLARFIGPARMFAAERFVLPNGKVAWQYGIPLLGIGVFFGVLATGYMGVLLQMYATNVFAFGPTQNGYLMSFFSLIRGFFLMFAFPRIIDWGRRRSSSGSKSSYSKVDTHSSIPIEPEDFEAIPVLQTEQEPIVTANSGSAEENLAFDLQFLKWSLIVDCILTGSAAFARKGWHVYLAAFLLPLASGSSSAAKGVMMQMCSQSKRAEALSAITLVEMTATLSTVSIFGFMFSVFAGIGKPYLIFICNAGVAVLAVFILSFSNFPAKGSRRLEISETENNE